MGVVERSMMRCDLYDHGKRDARHSSRGRPVPKANRVCVREWRAVLTLDNFAPAPETR
jgi:hypothetical protein